MNLLQPTRDMTVGRMTANELQTEVVIRNGQQIVIKYRNTMTLRGFEVGYSAKAVGEFNDILAMARRVAEGRGGT